MMRMEKVKQTYWLLNGGGVLNGDESQKSRVVICFTILTAERWEKTHAKKRQVYLRKVDNSWRFKERVLILTQQSSKD